MTDDFANELCDFYTSRVDHVSLHSANPGNSGLFEIAGTGHQSLTWPAAVGGQAVAAATFAEFNGQVAYLGLWHGSTFVDSRPYEVDFGATANLVVTIVHNVRPRSV